MQIIEFFILKIQQKIHFYEIASSPLTPKNNGCHFFLLTGEVDTSHHFRSYNAHAGKPGGYSSMLLIKLISHEELSYPVRIVSMFQRSMGHWEKMCLGTTLLCHLLVKYVLWRLYDSDRFEFEKDNTTTVVVSIATSRNR